MALDTKALVPNLLADYSRRNKSGWWCFSPIPGEMFGVITHPHNRTLLKPKPRDGESTSAALAAPLS